MAEDTGTATATETDDSTEEAQPDPQFQKLMDRMDQFGQRLDERLAPIEEALQQPDADQYLQQFDAATEDPGLTENDYDAQGQITPEAAQRELNRMIDERAAQIAEERVRAAVTPLQEQREAERRAAEADAIEAKYPELQDNKVLNEMVQKTIEEAQKMGRPELAAEPKFFEMVYLAEKAGESAGQESPDGAGRDVSLESAGGASAAGADEEEDDTGDRIVKLAQSKRIFN